MTGLWIFFAQNFQTTAPLDFRSKYTSNPHHSLIHRDVDREVGCFLQSWGIWVQTHQAAHTRSSSYRTHGRAM